MAVVVTEAVVIIGRTVTLVMLYADKIQYQKSTTRRGSSLPHKWKLRLISRLLPE